MSWTPGATGAMRLSKSLKLTLDRVDGARREHARPRSQNRVQAVARLLPLRRGADRAVDGARRDVVLALPRVADITSSSAAARQSRRNVPSRSSSGAARTCGRIVRRRRIADADQHAAVLIAHLDGAEPEQALARERAAERERSLLPIERRIAGQIGIDRLGQRLPALIAQVERGRTVRRLAARRVTTLITETRIGRVGGEAVGRHLKFLHGVLRDVLQRAADDVVVVVHAVDGDVAAASRLTGRRHDHRLRLGGIEVGRRRVARGQKRELEEVPAVERQRLDLARPRSTGRRRSRGR